MLPVQSTSSRTHGGDGFFRGLVAPLRGMVRVLSAPSLWLLAAVPTLLTGLFVALSMSALRPLHGRISTVVQRLLGPGSRWSSLLSYTADALVGLVLLLLALLLALVFVPVLSAPAMDRLAARVDRLPSPEESTLAGIARALRCALLGLLVFVLPQAVLGLLGLVAPPLAPLVALAGPVLAGLGLAWDALDWPLSRRGLGARARLAWVQAHPAPTAGLAVSVSLMALLPGLPVLLLPWIVAGAVELLCDLEGRATPG